MDPHEPLRILVANGVPERFEEVIQAVQTLKHQVVAHANLADVAALTASLRPDVAIVIVSESSGHALALIRNIVKQAACPVIAVLDVQDPAFVKEAAKLGIFAYIGEGQDPQEFQGSIDIALRRFAEYHNLEGAFGRRAITDVAKGILMERHGIDQREAFNMLRDHARHSGRKVVEIAEAIIDTHRLLPSTRGSGDSEIGDI